MIKDTLEFMVNKSNDLINFTFKSSLHIGSSSSTKNLKIIVFVVSEYSNQKFNNIVQTLFYYQSNKNRNDRFLDISSLK